MKFDVAQNAKRNVLFAVISRIVGILAPFCVRTVIIRKLGMEYLGLNSLFTSILNILNLTELGIGSTLVFSMYKPIAEDDTETICNLMNFYRKCYRAIGCAVFGIGLAILPFLKYLIKADVPADINMYILYFLYLSNTAFGYFLFAYKNSLLTALQRSDISNKISSVLTLLQAVCQCAVLLLFCNYYLYVGVMILAVIAQNLITAGYVDRHYPEYKAKGELNPTLLDEIKKKVAGMFIHKVSTVVLNSADSIVLSAFLGLRILGIYDNYYYIMAAIISMLSIITNSVVAGIGNRTITDGLEKNYQDFQKVNFAYMWLISVCGSCFLCLYQPFIKIWAKEGSLLAMSSVYWLVFYFLSLKMCDIVALYKNARGLWWEDRFRPVVSAAINLVLNILLVNTIGLNGVLISTIAVSIGINFIFGTKVLFAHYFKKDPKPFIWDTFFDLAVGFAASVGAFGVCSFVPDLGIPTLILKGIVCVAVSNGILWAIFHKRKQYIEAKAWLLPLFIGSLKK